MFYIGVSYKANKMSYILSRLQSNVTQKRVLACFGEQLVEFDSINYNRWS